VTGTSMRIGAFVSEVWGPASSLDEVRLRARAIEAAGLASGWAAYLPWAVDAITAAHVAGLATSRIDVGTAVVPTYLWHPLALARHAGTVAADLDGRFVLGIGPSHAPVIEMMHGIPYHRPARHTREVLDVLHAANAGTGRVDYEGELFTIRALYANGPAAGYPVWVGAMGERMLAVAGAHADGTHVTMCTPAAVATAITPAITAAAAAAGRPAPRIAATVAVTCTHDVEAARAAADTAFAGYQQLPRYRRVLELGGVSGAPEVVVIGDVAAIRTRLREYADAGVTDFLGAPFAFGSDPAAEWQRTIDALAEVAAEL
jgi:F420-dependent oxidoreductase-like protein